MPSQFNHRYELLALIATFWLLGSLSVPNLARSGYYLSPQTPQNNTQDPIPEATKPCTKHVTITGRLACKTSGRKAPFLSLTLC